MSDDLTVFRQEVEKRVGISITAIQDLLGAVRNYIGLMEARIKELENLLDIQKKAEGDKNAKKSNSLHK